MNKLEEDPPQMQPGELAATRQDKTLPSLSWTLQCTPISPFISPSSRTGSFSTRSDEPSAAACPVHGAAQEHRE